MNHDLFTARPVRPAPKARLPWLAVIGLLLAPALTVLGTSAADAAIPDASNTGVPSGVTLRDYDGPLTITTDGTVLDGYDIQGCLDIKASNVTVRNSRIRCGNGTTADNRDHIIRTHDGGPTLVEHVELDGLDTPWTMGVLGSNTTVRHTDIHGVGDAIKVASNSLYEYNYIHDLTSGEGQHNDGFQMSSGKNATIRYNNVVRPPEQTSVFMIKADLGEISDVTIEGNWVQGGNYTLYLIGQGPSDGSALRSDTPYPATNIVVRNNHFSSEYNHGALLESYVDNLTWDCNYFLESGEVLPFTHEDHYIDGVSSTDDINNTNCDAADEPTAEPTTEPTEESSTTEPTEEPTTEPATAPDLVYGTTTDRTDRQALDGAVLEGDVYVQLANDADVDVATFSVDGTEYRTEQDSPFDLEGETQTDTGTWELNATDTTTWSEGTHTISAALSMLDGSSQTVSATVTVDNVDDSTAEPEPEPTAERMYVTDLDGTLTYSGPRWHGSVTIEVRDNLDAVVKGVEVTGKWSPDGSSSTCTTGHRGRCTVDSPWMHRKVKEVRFDVTSLAHDDLAHEPHGDSDKDADSNGRSILLVR